MTLEDRITDALNFAQSYGQEDGAHHKMWVIDRMVRSLTGCPLVDRTAVDAYGNPYTWRWVSPTSTGRSSRSTTQARTGRTPTPGMRASRRKSWRREKP